MRRDAAFLLTAALTGVTVGVIPATSVSAAPATATCSEDRTGQRPNDPISALPWPQKYFAPEKVWRFSTGKGVTVAVVDSGTDARHPQLIGRVDRGVDYLVPGGTGQVDCVSHGTAVASIIAAAPQPGIGFRGLAPDARILPLRVSEREVDQTGGGTGRAVDPARFATAIRDAVNRGATVVNLSLVLSSDSPPVEAAVAYARNRDVVVVAAAGNGYDPNRPDRVVMSYPAAYDGVIGVGAITEAGTRWSGSQVGPYVDLVAPGEKVVAATRVRGHGRFDGTSFATAFVSATAALVRARYPTMTAREVERRLLATASPAMGGRDRSGYGWGVVDPYRAVTEELVDGAPVAAQPIAEPSRDPQAEAWAARQGRMRQLAIVLATGAVAATVVALFAALAIPRGRRRRWRPGRPPPLPPRRLPDDDSGPLEPTDLFTAPPRR